jgi:hypothetical protein
MHLSGYWVTATTSFSGPTSTPRNCRPSPPPGSACSTRGSLSGTGDHHRGELHQPHLVDDAVGPPSHQARLGELHARRRNLAERRAQRLAGLHPRPAGLRRLHRGGQAGGRRSRRPQDNGELRPPHVVGERRNLLLVPLRGIYLAWVIGSRVGQLPHRDWPARIGLIPVHDRGTLSTRRARWSAAWHWRAINPGSQRSAPVSRGQADQQVRPPDREAVGS